MPDTTATARGATLSAAELTALRKHVVHTEDGRLATAASAKPRTVDDFKTTADDVKRMIDVDLGAFVDQQAKKTPAGEVPPPVPVLIWAHGGLTDKAAGLQTAQRQVAWWKKNGVYPLSLIHI